MKNEIDSLLDWAYAELDAGNSEKAIKIYDTAKRMHVLYVDSRYRTNDRRLFWILVFSGLWVLLILVMGLKV